MPSLLSFSHSHFHKLAAGPMDSQGILRVWGFFFYPVWKSSTYVRSFPARSERCQTAADPQCLSQVRDWRSQKSPICSRAALTPKALSGVLKQNPQAATWATALTPRQNVTPELGSIRHRGLHFFNLDPHHKLQDKTEAKRSQPHPSAEQPALKECSGLWCCSLSSPEWGISSRARSQMF